jgi:hypothetical protein
MTEFLDIMGQLETLPGPRALATLLKGPGAGARLILEAAGGAPATELQEAVQGVVVSGRTRTILDTLGPEWGAWQGCGGVLLERMVPGKLPPWVHFCAQVARRGGSCVLATVGVVEGDIAYALGDRFAYDERNHGLLPMDGRFSLDLQRGCDKARAAGGPVWRRFDLTSGALGILLEPLAPE